LDEVIAKDDTGSAYNYSCGSNSPCSCKAINTITVLISRKLVNPSFSFTRNPIDYQVCDRWDTDDQGEHCVSYSNKKADCPFNINTTYQLNASGKPTLKMSVDVDFIKPVPFYNSNAFMSHTIFIGTITIVDDLGSSTLTLYFILDTADQTSG